MESRSSKNLWTRKPQILAKNFTKSISSDGEENIFYKRALGSMNTISPFLIELSLKRPIVWADLKSMSESRWQRQFSFRVHERVISPEPRLNTLYEDENFKNFIQKNRGSFI